MNYKKHLGEWFCILGVVLITVMLIDPFGYARALLLGCGVALIVGGLIRTIKEVNNISDINSTYRR